MEMCALMQPSYSLPMKSRLNLICDPFGVRSQKHKPTGSRGRLSIIRQVTNELIQFNKEGIKQIGIFAGTDEPSWTPWILGMASLLSSTVIGLALILRTPVYDPLYGRIAAAFKELCFPTNFNTNIWLVGSIVHLLKMVGNATLQMVLKSSIIVTPLIVHLIKVVCPMIFELWKGLLPPFTSPKSQGNYQSSDNVVAVKPALEDPSRQITIVLNLLGWIQYIKQY